MFSSEAENTTTWHGHIFTEINFSYIYWGDNMDVKSIIKYSNFGKSLGWDRNWIGSLK